MTLKDHQQIHKQPEFMCYMCNYANKNQELLHKHKESDCHIQLFKCDLCNYNNNERKQIKEQKNICAQMPVCKCYIYKTLIGTKMVEKHKTRKNQQTFDKCNMCNNTMKVTLYCIPTRKATKVIKKIVNAVDGPGLANNYDRQIQVQTIFRSTCAMLK